MIRIVHCKKEPYDIYIGRPSKWGNPFSYKENTIAKFKVKTLDDCLKKYREWVLKQPKLLRDLLELDGKVLGCWCTTKQCHGYILKELVELKKWGML